MKNFSVLYLENFRLKLLRQILHYLVGFFLILNGFHDMVVVVLGSIFLDILVTDATEIFEKILKLILFDLE